MNKGQIIGLVGGIIALIGLFLPWISASGTNTNTGQQITVSVPGIYFIPFSIGIILFAVLTIAFAIFKKPIGGILVLVFSLIGLAITGFLFSAIQYIAASLVSGSSVSVSTGVGVYICIVGFIIGLIGGVLHYVYAKKEGVTQTSPPQEVPPAPPPA